MQHQQLEIGLNKKAPGGVMFKFMIHQKALVGKNTLITFESVKLQGIFREK